MLLVHTADLHLASPLTARLSGERLRTRKREVGDALRTVVEDGRARGAKGVLIVGDLFDSDAVLQHTVSDTLALMASYAPLPFFYVAGNHEGRTLTGRDDLPSNLFVFGDTLTTYSLGTVTVSGTSAPLSRQMLSDIHMPKDTYNILLLHTAVGERTDGEHLRPSDLADAGIDYVALGHYHSYAVHAVNERSIAVYAGTPEGRGFDEVGPKGYVLIDTDRHTHTFVRTARRAIYDLSADMTEAITSRDMEHTIEAALTAADVRSEDMVRVSAIGRVSAGLRRDIARLGALFEGRYFHFELRDRTRPQLDTAAFAFDRSLKGEFVRLVMEDAALSEEDKDAIIDCGLTYLQESGR